MVINGHWRRLGRAAEADAGAMFALGIEWLMGDRRMKRIPAAAAKRNRVQRLICPSKDMQKRSSRTHQSLLLHSFFAKILQNSLLLEFFRDRIPVFPPNDPFIPSRTCHLYTGRSIGQQTRRTTKREEGRAVIPKSHPLLYCIIIITRNKIASNKVY